MLMGIDKSESRDQGIWVHHCWRACVLAAVCDHQENYRKALKRIYEYVQLNLGVLSLREGHGRKLMKKFLVMFCFALSVKKNEVYLK